MGKHQIVVTVLLLLWLPVAASPSLAAIALVVAPENPVESLSHSQVANIFLGRSHNFPDGGRAVPVDLSEGSETRKEFYRDIVNWTPAQVKAHWSRIIFTGRGEPPRQMHGAGELKAFIAENPSAIGYIDENKVDESVKVLELSP